MRTISLTLLSIDVGEHLFGQMPQSSYFMQITLHLRDQWLKVEALLKKESASTAALNRVIEDANELVYFIQDLYEVLKPEFYQWMLTQSLLKIFFLPVVI